MLKETLVMLKAAGCSTIRTTRGKHHKIRFKTPGGNQGFLVVSITTGDTARAAKNIKMDINHIIKRLDNDNS